MKITKKNFNTSIKLTKDYDSISFTEGFEVELDEDNAKELLDFNDMKKELVERLYSEAKDFTLTVLKEKIENKGKIDLSLDFKKANEINLRK